MKMGSKSKKVTRKPSFKTTAAGPATSSGSTRSRSSPSASSSQYPVAVSTQPRKWEVYSPFPASATASAGSGNGSRASTASTTAQSRLVMGYYNSARPSTGASSNYCCDDCSLPSSENEYWPPKVNKQQQVVQRHQHQRPQKHPRSHHGGHGGGHGNGRSSRHHRTSSSNSSKVSQSARNKSSSSHHRYDVMTMTKTMVSLKSCRSVSEIETLPPSGYLTSTVIQKSTYVNDDFVSDEDEDAVKYVCRDICCKER